MIPAVALASPTVVFGVAYLLGRLSARPQPATIRLGRGWR